jgi:putative FmdB family regulatory protein
MPIYEYLCPKCHKIFEEWTRAAGNDARDALQPCPHCEQPSPRVMSQTSFVLKGEGWYVSDYGYRKGIKEDGKDLSNADSKAADNVAAKPADGAVADDAPKPSATETAADKKAEKPKATKKNAARRRADASAP